MDFWGNLKYNLTLTTPPPNRERLLQEETGTLFSAAHERVALVYPSPYNAGMSSLGFLSIYRQIHESGRAADRAFLPDHLDMNQPTALLTLERNWPLKDYPVLAFSVAYEMEIAGLIQCLMLAGIPPLRKDRTDKHPFILCGGPLTFSNPLPLAPFADAVLMGEADGSINPTLDILFSEHKRTALQTLSDQIPSAFVPELHGESMPEIAKADLDSLPAYSPIQTPNTELRNMFLIEAERGCSRGCKYCVMRRSTNGGMRMVKKEKLLDMIPVDAKRVGLVGAAVSDHLHIVDIVEALADRGASVGLSSLRPDRLNDRFVAALKRAGYKTLTTASDGSSQRLRNMVERKAQERHLENAARLVREHKLQRLKLYMMVGLPTENDDDIEELAVFLTQLSALCPVSLGIAPFVAKRNTPLDGEPFAGIKEVDHRLDLLRKRLKGRVDLRSTSSKWAWIEYVLAQGGIREGEAVIQAVQNGANFKAYKDAFSAIPKFADPTQRSRALRVVA